MTYMYDETTRSNVTNVEHVPHNTRSFDRVNRTCSGREQYEIVSMLHAPSASSLLRSFSRTLRLVYRLSKSYPICFITGEI